MARVPGPEPSAPKLPAHLKFPPLFCAHVDKHPRRPFVALRPRFPQPRDGLFGGFFYPLAPQQAQP